MRYKWLYGVVGIILAIPIVVMAEHITNDGPTADELVEFEIEMLYEIYAEGIVCIQRLGTFDSIRICERPMEQQKANLYEVVNEMREHLSIIEGIKYDKMEPHLDFRE